MNRASEAEREFREWLECFPNGYKFSVATRGAIASHVAELLSRHLSPAEGEVPINETGTARIINEVGKLGCLDCGRPYGDEYGFPDLIIDNDAWKKIAPNHDEGGLLCPNCICARLELAGIVCSGRFTSGPLASLPAPVSPAAWTKFGYFRRVWWAWGANEP